MLDILANYLQQEGLSAGRTYLSSFEGLLALYQDKVDVAACHLYDGSGYNAGFVRSLVPGIPAVLVNVSYRSVGFYVRRGNPKGIHGWEDLARRDVSILNRRPGSSSRILLDVQLKRLGLAASNIRGYDKLMRSHLTMAAAIAEGEADLAIGTERISRQMDGIDFIPLLEERYDVALKKERLDSLPVQKLIAVMNQPAFRRELSRFSGNDYRDSGKIIQEV